MKYHANVVKFFIFCFLINLHLWIPIWIIFLQDRGMSYVQIGVLDSIVLVIMTIMEIFTGAVADKYGRKTSMLIGTLLFSLGMLGLVTQVLSPIFILGFIIWGTSFTFISGADMAFLYDSLKAENKEDKYNKLMGRYLFIVQGSQLLASLLGGYIASLDMTYNFIITSVISLVAFVVALTFNEPPQSNEGSSNDEKSYFQTVIQGLRIFIYNSKIRYIVILGALLIVMPVLLTLVVIQPYAIHVGYSVANLGLIIVCVRIAGMIGSLTSNWFSRKYNHWSLISIVLLVIMICYALIWIYPMLVTIVPFAIISFVASLVRPVMSDLLNKSISGNQRATILSIQSLLFTLFLTILEPLIFILGEKSGLPMAVGLSGIFLVTLSLILIKLWRSSEIVFLKKEKEYPEIKTR
ncbi:Predicted arabinose efflux permease, MFS family [Oceanobacillus limi]|uniref:Predicted arabinose efflux permease, MFS family n=1 Tax=Oceanobacillus limi TaxID=930131 RepID=A0A1H9YFG4_9BACI|nr:MFS transporter [Oceanobacillus limi]SES67759.1 Predicted arabinose efflux permease, MFS family [Oceanobacillus limi]